MESHNPVMFQTTNQISGKSVWWMTVKKNDEIMIIFWGFRGWHQKKWGCMLKIGGNGLDLLSHAVAYLEVYTMFLPLST